MEFDTHLLQLQGSLISAQNNLGPLCDVTTDSEQFKTLSTRIQGTMDKWPEDYDKRRGFLYLLLNSDLAVVDSLAEDEVIGHLIGTAPCLAKEVAVHLVLRVGSFSCLQEVITYGPPAMSAEIIDRLVSAIGSLTQDEKESVFADLLKACYHKLLLSECAPIEIQYKFFTYFKIIKDLECSLVANEILALRNLYQFAGAVAFKFLDILAFCTRVDLKENPMFLELDLLSYSQCTSEWTLPSTVSHPSPEQLQQECRDIVILLCVRNLQSISVDMWLAWAEMDTSSSKTLQQCVGELAYICRQNLEENRSGVSTSSCTELLHILQGLSIRPRCEEDEIREATLDVILDNVVDEKRDREKWMIALLAHDECLKNEKAISAIVINSNLLKERDVSCLLKRITQVLRQEDPCVVEETLKKIPSQVMQHLCYEDHVKILTEYFSENELHDKLCCNDFGTSMTELFNKMVVAGKPDSELLCEAIRLCIQNPKSVVENALCTSIQSHQQVTVMSSVLSASKPVSRLVAADWISRIAESCHLTSVERDMFPECVSMLLKEQIVELKSILRKYLLPAVQRNVNEQRWSDAFLWQSTLQRLFEERELYVKEVVVPTVLLAFLAQILEKTQQMIASFSADCLSFRKAVISTVKSLEDVDLSEKEQQWLQFKLGKYSPTTNHYFRTFSQQLVNDSEDGLSASVLLQNFPKGVDQIETVVCRLVEMLPSLTIEEWKLVCTTILENLCKSENKTWIVFQMFRKAMLLITVVSARKSLPSAESIMCLNYCVRSFGVLIKDEIFHCLDEEHSISALVETLHMMSKMPDPVWENSAMVLVPVLVSVMASIPPTPEAGCVLRAAVNICPENVARSLFQQKMTEFFGCIETNEEISVSCDRLQAMEVS